METPAPLSYSDNSEGLVLRDFVDEEIAQEKRLKSPSQRSERLSQATSHPCSDSDVGPPPRKHSRHRSHNGAESRYGLLPARGHSRSSSFDSNGSLLGPTRMPQGAPAAMPEPQHHAPNIPIPQLQHRRAIPQAVGDLSEATHEELLNLLMEQKKESHQLKRALRLASGRIDADAQRVLAMERAHSEATESINLLNERRFAAQQEALKAGSELRLYQFQFERAQREIAKAEEMLKVAEEERNTAERAEALAKKQAREFQLERAINAAREEARREGFAMGLRQVQDDGQRGTRNRRKKGARLESIDREYAQYIQYQETIKHPVEGDAFDEASQASSPARRQPHDLHTETPPAITIEAPDDPEGDDVPPAPPEPTSVAPPTLDPPRSHTPSVQVFALDIPAASELERQNSMNEYPGRHPQPWLTAEQHLQMTSQQSPSRNTFQSGLTNGGTVTFAPQPAKTGKKESWFRTLSRRLTGKRQPDVHSAAPAPNLSEQPTSWYNGAAPKPAPPVLAHDYAPGQPQPVDDSVSVSKRMSQLGIVPPPRSMASKGSESSFNRGGARGRRNARGPDRSLHVINEDPASRVHTPVIGEAPRASPNMGQPPMLHPSPSAPVEAEPRYSHQTAVDDWRRSSSSFQPRGPTRPGGPRRPANLTVPAPLSTPRSRTMSNNTQSSSFVRAKDSIPALDNPPSSSGLSPIGIRVEPPSRSPTEPVSSALPQEMFLSPRHAQEPSLSSAPSVSGLRPQPVVQQQQRPASTASRGPAPLPTSVNVPKSPALLSQPLPPDHPPSQQWQGERPQRNSVSQATPRPTDRPPTQSASGAPGRRSVNLNTPRQGSQNLPSTAAPGGAAGGSHRRTVSDTYLTPGTNYAGLPPQTSEQALHRVPSNQSMQSVQSTNSQYAKYDASTYLDPAYYPPIGINPKVDKGKGVDRGPVNSVQRSPSVSSSLSYADA